MNIVESVRIAFSALLANKLRAMLTMLGIIIGVGSVVGMLAIGNGFQQYFNSQFEELGVGTLYILPFVDSNKIDDLQSAQLSAADAEALRRAPELDTVEAVAVEYSGNGQITAQGQRYTFGLRGVTPDFFAVSPQDLSVGRYLSAEDERAGARVALVGKLVAERVFGSNAAALNQRITVNGVGFEVIGVLATEPGSLSFGTDPAEAIFVPYNTAVSRLYRSQVTDNNNVSVVTAKLRDRDEADLAIRQITDVLRREHRLTYQDNDFTIINLDQFQQQANAVLGGFSAFLIMIAGISLLVGGIGIMNIMLVSVTERTREIGLRKAVGARRRDILLQFLIEALVLCLVGGAIGVGIGYGMSFVGTFVLEVVFQAEGARATVTTNAIVLAAGIAAAIGIFFGFFPALQASRLNPIDALRTE